MPTPRVEQIEPAPGFDEAMLRFAAWPGLGALRSSLIGEARGRYSSLFADPVATFLIDHAGRVETAFSPGIDPGLLVESHPNSDAAPFALPALWQKRLATDHLDDLAPFQGGLAGVVNYEAGRLWERLPRARHDDERFPLATIGLYDWVVAWDHLTGRCWLIFHPLTELRSTEDADQRWKRVTDALAGRGAPFETPPARPPAAATPDLAASFACPRLPGLVSNFDRPGYLKAVERVIRYIHAGDIFQANLSQRFAIPASSDPIALFLKLGQVNPAPFAGYYDAGSFQIISASPERFLRLTGDEVETRPIKGTRPRRPGVEADLLTRDELRESAKDRAENVMIVDLLRNDLSRVCRPGSIRVLQLCAVETYETVQHLVSEVRGSLKPGVDFFDLLAATFPGGSITGAPKIRAMEIITELEQVSRGPYCGTMFYYGFSGQADSSILIRTFTQMDGLLRFPAGGGITAQSNPDEEYHETLHKVEGLLRALE